MDDEFEIRCDGCGTTGDIDEMSRSGELESWGVMGRRGGEADNMCPSCLDTLSVSLREMRLSRLQVVAPVLSI